MKKPLSIILICSNLVLINVTWPVKIKYSDLTYLLYGSFILSLLSFLFLPIISRSKSLFSVCTNFPKLSQQLFALFYLTLITGGYLGYNLSILLYFSHNNVGKSLSVIYPIICISSVIAFVVLSAVDMLKKTRVKYPMVYGIEMNTEEFLTSAWANLTVSEFTGLALGFYSALFAFLMKGLYYLAEVLNLFVVLVLILVFIGLVAGGVVLFSTYKSRLRQIASS
jgi:hypothetical protein